MVFMFRNCSSLTSIDASSFNTSKVTNMSEMFRYCSSLTSIDVSSFDTLKVTNMGYMFNSNSNLSAIYVSNLWNTDNVTNSDNMFVNDTKLPNYNSSVVDKTNAHYGEGGYLTYKAHN
jgi:surface protein